MSWPYRSNVGDVHAQVAHNRLAKWASCRRGSLSRRVLADSMRAVQCFVPLLTLSSTTIVFLLFPSPTPNSPAPAFLYGKSPVERESQKTAVMRALLPAAAFGQREGRWTLELGGERAKASRSRSARSHERARDGSTDHDNSRGAHLFSSPLQPVLGPKSAARHVLRSLNLWRRGGRRKWGMDGKRPQNSKQRQSQWSLWN